jgi:hypothetical protein
MLNTGVKIVAFKNNRRARMVHVEITFYRPYCSSYGAIVYSAYASSERRSCITMIYRHRVRGCCFDRYI